MTESDATAETVEQTPLRRPRAVEVEETLSEDASGAVRRGVRRVRAHDPLQEWRDEPDEAGDWYVVHTYSGMEKRPGQP